MKNLAITFVLIIAVLSCKKKENSITESIPKIHVGYFIKGIIKSPDKTSVYLQKKERNKSFTTIKTTQILNNQFSFSDTIASAKLFYIGFSNSNKKIPVIANNFDTFITIDSKTDKSIIKGSPLQENYTKYSTDLTTAKNKFVYKLEYIKNNSNSILSAIILQQMLGKTKWRLGQNKKAYAYLSTEIQNSNIGKEIALFIMENEPLVEEQESIAEVSMDPKISNEAPVNIVAKKSSAILLPKRRKATNFYGESINGNDISLASITKNAKVTLIDFWASWCEPCRAQNPHLKRLYNKYHSKGFHIVGISEDKYVDLNTWKNAIATDGLNWNHIIDDNGRIAGMFGVKGIPHTVLLDQNGGIIFAKKSSYTIEKKLKEIFGF